LGRLDRFVGLLLRWQRTTNLIAPSTVSHLWTRHIADSLQLLDLAPDAQVWIDLGTGGGFPGLVVACALAEKSGAHVHLIESNAKGQNAELELTHARESPIMRAWTMNATLVPSRIDPAGRIVVIRNLERRGTTS
jgi:16S rRNA G527 N7-methylase RsmG